VGVFFLNTVYIYSVGHGTDQSLLKLNKDKISNCFAQSLGVDGRLSTCIIFSGGYGGS